mgnify:CR=1 FL=1
MGIVRPILAQSPKDILHILLLSLLHRRSPSVLDMEHAAGGWHGGAFSAASERAWRLRMPKWRARTPRITFNYDLLMIHFKFDAPLHALRRALLVHSTLWRKIRVALTAQRQEKVFSHQPFLSKKRSQKGPRAPKPEFPDPFYREMRGRIPLIPPLGSSEVGFRADFPVFDRRISTGVRPSAEFPSHSPEIDRQPYRGLPVS